MYDIVLCTTLIIQATMNALFKKSESDYDQLITIMI